MSAVRSIGKASAVASDVNTLHRALGCLFASGEIRSMYFSGVIVASFLAFLEHCGLYTQPDYLQWASAETG